MTIEECTAPREETMEKDKDKKIEEDEKKIPYHPMEYL